jgi:hypothetical protein
MPSSCAFDIVTVPGEWDLWTFAFFAKAGLVSKVVDMSKVGKIFFIFIEPSMLPDRPHSSRR